MTTVSRSNPLSTYNLIAIESTNPLYLTNCMGSALLALASQAKTIHIESPPTAQQTGQGTAMMTCEVKALDKDGNQITPPYAIQHGQKPHNLDTEATGEQTE